uniref:LysM domain receptor-like kinase 4 n=1 Tax=Tanacetum cinerariifolium TaxID=118510 RepID=A0A699GWL4_TANCI|nr:LysM domain receptor-like kinase 4 [Tanacetum cinerariifolium]
MRLEDREVVVPIVCNCPDWSSRAVVNYTNNNSYSFSDIACQVYQGMVKPFVLVQYNGNIDHETSFLKVPVKCACVNSSHETNGTKYLVTYPVMENDTVVKIAQKFGVTQWSIQDVNGLDWLQTIFGGTTLLVPTMGPPVLNLDHAVSGTSPQDTIPVNGIVNRSVGSRFSFFLILFASISLFGVILFLLYLKLKFRHGDLLRSLSMSVTGSIFKRISPNLLDDMSKLKHLLTNFCLDELKLATQDFSESSSIGQSIYKGKTTDGFSIVIEEMGSIESANHVICILTTINHFNVVRLEGCCFDENKSYLVFEYTKNGSLRDCLCDSETRKQLTWEKRVKIAFDLAEGLHYIHYCTKPTYVHHNISTQNVLITDDWRAKISGFNLANPISYTVGADGDDEDDLGNLSPEHLDVGRASTKVDMYAYGIVLLELLSAKKAASGRKWLDRVEFLADCEVIAGSSNCLEKFKVFMDVDLEGEYGLGDALCLALLAKCCIQDEPHIRPTMNDVLKALSRIS